MWLPWPMRSRCRYPPIAGQRFTCSWRVRRARFVTWSTFTITFALKACCLTAFARQQATAPCIQTSPDQVWALNSKRKTRSDLQDDLRPRTASLQPRSPVPGTAAELDPLSTTRCGGPCHGGTMPTDLALGFTY